MVSIVLSDLDHILIKHLDPYDDYKNLIQVNKYYNNFIRNNKLYQELQELHKKIDPLNPSVDYNHTYFPEACKYGYLKVAKYLYKKYLIDIHIDNELALRWAYRNGHSNVIEWLYNLSSNNIPNIYKLIIFDELCSKGYKNIIIT